MAGLRGPVRREPPPQLKGVTPLPGSSDDGDVRAATEGSLVPPGVSGAGAPKDCSKGLGSRFKEPPGPVKKSGVFAAVCCWPGRGGGARGLAGPAFAEGSGFRAASCCLGSFWASKQRCWRRRPGGVCACVHARAR